MCVCCSHPASMFLVLKNETKQGSQCCGPVMKVSLLLQRLKQWARPDLGKKYRLMSKTWVLFKVLIIILLHNFS